MTTVVPSFADIGLRPELLAELSVQGIDLPFPIQAATLPDSLAGRDVLGRGRTGSGKTLAFGLPTLHRIAGHRARSGRPKALVLVPTRELAQQVTTALTPYANALGLRCATVVGGLSLQRQADALRAGAELVVATPGRLHDLIDRGDVRLGEVRVTVLDEADRMADMGFLPQVTKLLEQVAPDGQRMLFSATLDGGVDRLVRRFLTNPVSHSVDPGTATVTAMTHHVLHVDADDKPGTLAQIAAREGRTILFMGTKHRADRLARQLLARGVRAAALHGGKSQPQRTRILEQFKTGAVTALVATDVAARGIHVDGLDLVVNVDPPAEAKDYLHRGGRTARAGESGTVVTLVLPEQRRDVVKLMSVAGIKPHVVAVRPGDEALVRVTGAREPSGVPVTIPVPAAAARVSAPVAKAGAGAGPGAPAGGRSPHRSSGRSRRSRRPRAS
ncbi:DEAD/DEAH box helicase [Micromonospora inyonensis]|uniref:Superfamily II DNA and RNA helicase n=1 Tax=Micromonospora inyonensis TaxID=47866 RepID=A0A1C6R8V8_9ACTN|nr:DEAD/DEAH box helicase [Micromonospora inyonensis]SCL13427.1 Superfamily II DNA and RNA helicase [Micromonospora inyonensis]